MKKGFFVLTIMTAILLLPFNTFASKTCKDIEGPFNSPQEVTKKCLECHPKAGKDMLKSRHWTWLGDEFTYKGKKMRLGKKNMLNCFCTSIISNWPRCTSCHPGYGWKDGSFDFTKAENIDCLVCHDQTGTYKKFPTAAGYPTKEKAEFMGNTFLPPDLVAVARSVGKPNRKNCGVCHFFGGGGDGVKHGDLDSSLIAPSKDLDVHMGENDFSCTECHETKNHRISGALHASMVQGVNHFDCTKCHESKTLHENVKMGKLYDKHTKRIACQTCHIPAFGRGMPTNTWWDWSTAGKDTKPSQDQYGKPTYMKMKGDLKWEKDGMPQYAWSNGRMNYYLMGETVKDPKQPLTLNKLQGNIDDPKAKIIPLKVMRSKQMVDAKHRYLIVPHLFGEQGFWKTWDREKSFEIGMKLAGLPYSGTYDWIETRMLWPLNHMVAPKENALKCTDCHGEKSRLDWKALGYQKGDPKNKKN